MFFQVHYSNVAKVRRTQGRQVSGVEYNHFIIYSVVVQVKLIFEMSIRFLVEQQEVTQQFRTNLPFENKCLKTLKQEHLLHQKIKLVVKARKQMDHFIYC